jgi:thioredoxin-related protein
MTWKSIILFHQALVVFFVSLCLMNFSVAKSFDDSEVKHIGYPGWFIESPFFDLTDDLEKTRSGGKKGLMVLFTTEGCSYCDVFIRKSLGDPKIAAAVQKNFDSVGMEIFDDVGMVNPQGRCPVFSHTFVLRKRWQESAACNRLPVAGTVQKNHGICG